jgi:hypothetical protein
VGCRGCNYGVHEKGCLGFIRVSLRCIKLYGYLC